MGGAGLSRSWLRSDGVLMGVILMGIVSLIYFGVAISMLGNGQYGMSLTFAAYAVANIGLIWQAAL